MKKYIQVNSQIYRLIQNDHWLLVTPSYNTHDRYMSIADMELLKKTNNAKIISERIALAEINKQFDNFSNSWMHNGVEYMVKNSSIDEAKTKEDMPKVHDIYPHYCSYYIISFRGKLYYCDVPYGSYYPRTLLYEFKINPSINDKPLRWVDLRHCKTIFFKNEKGTWESL